MSALYDDADADDYQSVQFTLLKHQAEFVADKEHRFLALQGGLGSGKTQALCAKAIDSAIAIAGHDHDYNALCEPTGVKARQFLQRRFYESLIEHGFVYGREGQDCDFTLNKSESMFTLKLLKGDVRIKMMGINEPEKLTSFEAAFVGIDEIDTVPNRDQIDASVDALAGRLRAGPFQQMFFTSTPEGYRFLYDTFEKNKNKDTRLIKACTWDNPYLKPSTRKYIESLYAKYPASKIAAYVFGDFVNLTGGVVYDQFDRNLNHTDETVDSLDAAYAARGRGPRPLHIGMDFNVGNMSAIVHAIVDGRPVAVDEIIGLPKTKDTIDEIKKRYGKRPIYIYADKSGASEKTSASESDIAQLKNAGFSLEPNGNMQNKNPAVKSRVDAMQAMFCNGKKERRYKINTNKCKRYTEALEQQPYDPITRAPFKEKGGGGADGPNDAGGYFIESRWPVDNKGAMQNVLLAA